MSIVDTDDNTVMTCCTCGHQHTWGEVKVLGHCPNIKEHKK
jgi:hypothetical protein